MPPRPKLRNLKASKDKEKEEETPPATRSTTPKPTSRTRVSAACEACKKRKTKCTGEPTPCHLCQVLGTECVIDLSLDMRRRAAMQQTIDDSKSYQELLNGLIDCIKDGDPDIIQSLRDTFLQSEVTRSEMSEVIQLCAQSVRSRWAQFQPKEKVQTGDDKSAEYELQPSFSNMDAEHVDEWSIEPSLRTQARTESAGEASDRFSILYRYLRHCSDAEASRLLGTLLDASSLDEVEQNVPVGSAYHQHVKRFRAAEDLYSSSQTDEAADTVSWHPTLPPATSALDTTLEAEVTEKTSAVASQGADRLYVSEVSVRRVQSGPTGKVSGVSNRPRESAAAEGLRGQQSFSQPLRSVGVALTSSYLLPVIRLTPAVSDLVIAKDRHGAQTTIPVHVVLPLLVPDDSSMSRVYTDYLQGARQMLLDEASVSQILGADDDVVVDLFFRHRQDSDVWDTASWACEFCRGFSEFDSYFRLAWVFMLTRLMQWLLKPTKENYARVPDMIKPSPMQRMIPHQGSIDLIPMFAPCLRDAVIENPRDWVTTLGEAKGTVNWPLLHDDAVEYVDGASYRRLTQRFIDHVSQYDNWSVGSHILTTFPEVASRIRLHD